jgi:hypothetical protein
MSYTFKGVVTNVGNEEVISDKFKKKNLVVQYNGGRFPKIICFEFTNDKIDALENVQSGQEVEVSFDVESREWNGKFFTSARGWKVENVGGQAQAAPQAQAATPAKSPVMDAEDDSLPF